MKSLPLCVECQHHHATYVTCPPWTWNILPPRASIEDGKRRAQARLYNLNLRLSKRYAKA